MSEAIKKVCGMLKVANGVNLRDSSSTVIHPENGSTFRGWVELTQYQQSRDEANSLIAAVTCDITGYLSLPYVVLTSHEINQTNFSGGLGCILLEPVSVIICSTDNLTKNGFSRLALILKDLKGLFDGRLTVLVHIKDKLPVILSEFVEKVFDPPSSRKRNPSLVENSKSSLNEGNEEDRVKNLQTPQSNKKLKPCVYDMNDDHDVVSLEKEREITQAKKRIEELNNLLERKEQEFETAINTEKKKAEIFKLDKERVQAELDALQKGHDDLREKYESVLSEKNRSETRIAQMKSKPSLSLSDVKTISIDSETFPEKSVFAKEGGEPKNQENTSIKSKVQIESMQQESNSVSDAGRLKFYKEKVINKSQNLKLSPKEIIFRSFRNLKVSESIVLNTENEHVCELKVTQDNSNILMHKMFVGSGPSRHKSIMAAYSNIVKFLAS